MADLSSYRMIGTIVSLFRRFMKAVGFEVYREFTEITKPGDTIERFKLSDSVKYRWRRNA